MKGRTLAALLAMGVVAMSKTEAPKPEPIETPKTTTQAITTTLPRITTTKATTTATTKATTTIATTTEAKPVLYNVPLDIDLQIYIITQSEAHGIHPSIIFAMIEKESTYRAEVLGDNGNSYGLMQIQPRWNKDRMDKLGVTDLLDPFQNVTVGIDLMGELFNDYGDIGKALMAYNMGAPAANKNIRKGICSSSYSRAVMERSEEIKGELK